MNFRIGLSLGLIFLSGQAAMATFNSPCMKPKTFLATNLELNAHQIHCDFSKLKQKLHNAKLFTESNQASELRGLNLDYFRSTEFTCSVQMPEGDRCDIGVRIEDRKGTEFSPYVRRCSGSPYHFEITSKAPRPTCVERINARAEKHRIDEAVKHGVPLEHAKKMQPPSGWGEDSPVPRQKITPWGGRL